ncbi:MAG: hypothetical protein M1836_006929 [Candelina mexicana]|nr:MAG: hypothetical protein M1836_006929 [Candelina mexicana]
MGEDRSRTRSGDHETSERGEAAGTSGIRHSWTHDISAYLILLMLITTLGPFQYGYHLAELNVPEKVIRCLDKQSSSTARSGLPQCIPMNSGEFGLVNSIFTPGGLLGAISAGPLAMKYGRLLTMRCTTLFFVIGGLMEALAPHIAVLAIGRFISGIGAGAAIVVVPIFISEVAPPNEKGMFGALTQIMINVGILIAQLIGYFLDRGQLWRVVLATAGAIGLFQLIALTGAIESPKWTADHRSPHRARKILRKIRGHGANIEAEVEAWPGGEGEEDREDEEESLMADHNRIERSHSTSSPSNENPKKAAVGMYNILWHPHYHKAVIAVVAVMLAQQLCGVNSIVIYGSQVLATLLDTKATILVIVVSAINLITTILCSPLPDKIGRKPSILISIAGMGTNACLLAISIIYNVPVLSAIATLLFVASFAVGLGPVPFILASELVGPEGVGATQSWALAANWIATFLVSQFFPLLNEAMGPGTIYFLFTGFAVAFFGFVAWWVPETNGKKDADEVWGRKGRDE